VGRERCGAKCKGKSQDVFNCPPPGRERDGIGGSRGLRGGIENVSTGPPADGTVSDRNRAPPNHEGEGKRKNDRVKNHVKEVPSY